MSQSETATTLSSAGASARGTHATPNTSGTGQRQHTRYTVPAMYSLIRARTRTEAHFAHNGHIYDVSLGGMRFELDDAIEPGTQLDVRAMLPGAEHVTFRATGTVVRLHNDDCDDRGPTRMGLAFERFKSQADRECVEAYVAARAGQYTPPQPDEPPRPLYAPPASRAA